MGRLWDDFESRFLHDSSHWGALIREKHCRAALLALQRGAAAGARRQAVERAVHTWRGNTQRGRPRPVSPHACPQAARRRSVTVCRNTSDTGGGLGHLVRNHLLRRFSI